MWKKLFWYLAKKRGTETLTNIYTGQEYMHRVFLGRQIFQDGIAGKYGAGRVCFNLILGSDLPVEHNHPWGYFTLILSGGYYEVRGEERKWRGPGWFAWRSHNDFHRVEIPEGGYAMTLFIKGKHGKMGSYFLDEGKPVKDLKFWLRRKVSRDKIGAMIKFKSPEEIQREHEG